jgi:hypothetical protein
MEDRMTANAFLDLGDKQIAAPRKARMRAAEKRATKKDKAEIECEDLRRAYVQWRKERREALFAGPHGVAARELNRFLRSMTLDRADALVKFVRAGNWQRADADTRFEVLSLINDAITGLRERHKLPPFDDALPDEPGPAFIIIRELFR